MENYLRNMDYSLFMQQKAWLYHVSVSDCNERDREYAYGLLHLLDCIQDYCEEEYGTVFTPEI